MMIDLKSRPPVVTDADRQWALEQEPADWATRSNGLEWATHVAEQAERFEIHYGSERKPMAEWSGLWRRAWWPKADPSILHPHVAPASPHPFVRRADPAWPKVVKVLNPAERQFAERFGVMQFKPDDPRAGLISNSSDAGR